VPKPAPKPTPKPTPKPAVKPTTKPVQKPLQLRADLTETVIQNGQLVTKTFTRAYTLPQKSVDLSRANGKLSTGIENELRRIFRSLELGAENANWVFEKGAWIARQTTGRNVDETQSRNAVLEAVKFNKSLAVVRINPVQPRRNVQDWYTAGIRHYFGGGTSTFYGSAPFRVANIVNGALKLHRTYIQPGEVFDFNRRVGQITEANGFVDGYIIKNGLLEKDVGGGICQVSTTMFRAAYESGLPIVQRNFHSYRVQYYDPVGYEATVFAPYKNLKFRNDTGGALYIQASWNTRRQWLTFSFFGPKPDRTASVGRPVVWKVIQPPATRWVADSAIRLGRVKALSGPERGMNVRIDRVVRMNSGEVRRDSTFSYYVPWGAIYAVNPNDARVNVRPAYSVTSGAAQRTGQTTRSTVRR
jgi:vancomycin resistance protein YoaR